jgi:LAGLIDADG endonuclease
VLLDSQWVVGFVDGEGCFHVGVARHPEMSLGVQVLPEFVVVQHKRDVKVLHALKRFFRCGVVRTNHGDRMCYRVRKLESLAESVVPFFERHELKTLKRQDFIRFRKVVSIMREGGHLDADGLGRIMAIAGEMNRGRNLKAGKVKSSSSRK